MLPMHGACCDLQLEALRRRLTVMQLLSMLLISGVSSLIATLHVEAPSLAAVSVIIPARHLPTAFPVLSSRP